MKRFIAGFLTAVLMLGCVGVIAANCNVEQANFPILVNGKEWTTDKPIVTIDGSTYLPLRALGNALGVKVEWNDTLNRVEIGETPVASANYSRTNPAPVNTAQNISYSDSFDEYGASVKVLETYRGVVAWEMLKQANKYNQEAEEGYEYILAKILVTMVSIKGEKAVDINNYSFNCYSTDNTEYDDLFILTLPTPKLSTSMFAGANAEGWTVFKVKKDDANPKIVFGQKYDGSGGIWFALK